MQFHKASKNYFGFTLDKSDFKYEPAIELLNALKMEIPSIARKYYPNEREWHFHNDHYPTFEKLFIEYMRKMIQADQFELF